MTANIIICLLTGYIFGNFSTAYFVGKREKVDIRKYGSGNAGTTNAFRTLGRKAGIMTFAGDLLKAVIPILCIRYWWFKDVPYVELLMLIAGFAAVMGHNFPFWLHFKGGKGIAVTAGVFVAFDIRIVPIGLLLFGGVVLITKYVSVGSLLIAALLPVWIAVTRYEDPYYAAMICTGCCYTISAICQHRANIKRLINGTENKIGQHVDVSSGRN